MHRVGSPYTQIYVTVFGSGARQDRALRRRRAGQRRDRRPPRHSPPSGIQVAQTLLRRAPGRPDRSASGRTAPEFSPDVMVAIKALACEFPATADPPQPLARSQCPDLARAAVESGIAAAISGTTIWRWLSSDAIKPWQHRSWIFPRDPDFGARAGPGARPLRSPILRPAAAARRVRHLRRREDLHPGPHP